MFLSQFGKHAANLATKMRSPLFRSNEKVNGALVSRRIMLKRMNMIKHTYVYKNKYVLVKMRSTSAFPCQDGVKLN